MVIYHAVKLIRLNKDGKLNPHARTYGLVYRYIDEPDRFTGHSDITPELWITEKSPKRLGMNYGNRILDGDFLSFKSPVDIVYRRNKGIEIWKAEDFPENLQEKFYKGLFRDLELDNIDVQII